jgi:hypothetical protein
VLPHAGHIAREAADRKAASEYDAFSERRRHEVEHQGEADAIRALEQAAKLLPARKSRKDSGA